MDKAILFIYLALFPFGQLLRISIFNASDILAILALIYLILVKKEGFKVLNPFKDLFLIALFSLLYSVFNFKSLNIFVGFLYFARVVAYFYLYKLSYNIVKKDLRLKETIFNSLLFVSFAVCLFGWIQYFFYPDLTSLKYLGWDDHLFRLVGTFLDPGFTSLIIVFGGLIAFIKKKYWLFIFFAATLAFTYSRAGYLAFAISLLVAALVFKRFKTFLFALVFFFAVILVLPKPAGQGVNLARTYSISLRIANYKETFKIFKKSPVFGIGFNNICLARKNYLKDINSSSHSCSGSDSSLLLILATTGIVGFMIFIGSLSKLLFNLKRVFYAEVFLVLLSAVFIHSFFANSLLYPWVMGYLAISASLVEE
jgi:O-antigen ligase